MSGHRVYGAAVTIMRPLDGGPYGIAQPVNDPQQQYSQRIKPAVHQMFPQSSVARILIVSPAPLRIAGSRVTHLNPEIQEALFGPRTSRIGKESWTQKKLVLLEYLNPCYLFSVQILES